jgi:outer membrane translocation and assembly module TamA
MRMRRVLLIAAPAFGMLACARVESGRYGVSRLDLVGMRAMRPEPLAACLITYERPSAKLKLGLSDPTCDRPPFDSAAPAVSLWRWPWTEWPTFNRAVFDQDLERVLRWYRARGYYAAKVVGVEFEPAEAAEPLGKSDCDPEREQCTVAIRVRIQEGEPVRVSELSLRGTGALPAALVARLQQRLALERCERFDEALYEDGKAALVQELKAVGHAAAKVEGRVRIDTKARSVSVAYDITPGPIYRFGSLRVTGQRNLPTAPIVAAAGLSRGTRYDPEVLREIQAEVFALGAFSAVEINETVDEAAQRVDIELRVTPLAPDQLRVGIGVLSGANRRTETGELTSIPQWDIHLFGSYERRHVFGTLGRVRIDERPRLIQNRDFPRFTTPEFGNVVGVGINQPGLLEARTDAFSRSEWDFGPDPFLGFRRSDVFVRVGARRAFFTRRLLATLAVQQDLFLVPPGRKTETSTGENETSDGDNETSDGSPVPTSYGYSYLEQDLRLDLRDDRVRPRRGAYLGLNATLAPRWATSDWSAIRVGPEARAYIPLPFDVVFAVRTAAAALFIFDASSDVDDLSERLGPSIYRLRGGGANSNRGFLAGRLGAGLQGGLRRWESSLELRVPFGSSLGSVLFADFGDVNDGERFRFGHLNTSLGFGLRYFTVIGALRLDAGFRIPGWQRARQPADGSSDIEPGADEFPFPGKGPPGALHLTIGESF